MLNRRSILYCSVAALTLPVGTCSAPTNTTVQGVIDMIKKACNFTTSADAIIAVILTVLTGFNAAAGAAATVAAAVAQHVADMVCAAVKAQMAQTQAERALRGTEHITVVVNGVKVSGVYGGA